MLTYPIDSGTPRPLYGFLYSRIKDDIISGKLRGGQKLPSKRTFAANLGVSVITVETAYSQLAAEGYITAEARRGFFVAEIRNPEKAHFLSPLVIAAKKSGLAEERETDGNPMQKTDSPQKAGESGGKYEFDLAGNRTNPANFPFSVWAKLMRSVLTERRTELMANSPPGGSAGLRGALSRHLLDFRGINVPPERIFVGAGTEYLYGLIIQLLGFERRYGSEDPGYSKTAQIYSAYGLEHDFISMDENGVLIRELEQKLTDIIHISPSHHFPTGTVMPVSRRYELLEWAGRAPTRYIIEDDYDSEFRFNGRPIPALQSMDPEGHVIYMNTFTKSLSSTVRISYMVLPPQLAEKFREKLGFYSCTVPTFEQLTLEQFISGGFFEKHINRMRRLYQFQRDEMLRVFAQAGEKITISEENSGLHFIMRINSGITEKEFSERLERNGIRMIPLSAYFRNSTGKTSDKFVVNYSSLPRNSAAAAAEAVISCL